MPGLLAANTNHAPGFEVKYYVFRNIIHNSNGQNFASTAAPCVNMCHCMYTEFVLWDAERYLQGHGEPHEGISLCLDSWFYELVPRLFVIRTEYGEEDDDTFLILIISQKTSHVLTCHRDFPSITHTMYSRLCCLGYSSSERCQRV